MIRNSIRKSITYFSYLPTIGFSAFFSLARIAVYAHLLDVEDFGLLTKLLLVSALFGVVGSFGFQLLAQRDLPSLFYGGRYKAGLISLSKAVIVTTIFALLMFAYSLLDLPIAGISGLLLCCAITHGWSQQVFMLTLIDARSRLEMTHYAKQSLFKTISTFLVAMVVLMFGGGVVGIAIAEIAVALLVGMALISKTTKNIKKSLLWVAAIRGFKGKEIKTATQIFTCAFLAFLGTNIDRWLAAEYLDSGDFGQYSFAWISLTAALSVQSLLNAGIFPLVSRKRKEKNSDTAFKITAYISLAMLFAGIIITISVLIFAQWFIPNNYQRYAPAIPLLMPLLFAAVLRISDFWSSYLIVVHRHHSLMKMQFFLILIALIYYQAIAKFTAISPLNFAWMAALIAAGNYIASALIAFLNRKYS